MKPQDKGKYFFIAFINKVAIPAKIEKVLKGLTPKTAKSKGKKSREYSQYLVMEIMNRAMTNILENSTKK